MRYILTLLALLIFDTSGCTLAMADFGNYRAIGVSDSATHRTKQRCVNKESGKAGFQGCFSITDCPPDECSLADVEVPDRDQDPTLVVTDEQACADEAECQSLIAQDGFCSDQSYNALWGDRDEDGSLEAWCTHPEWPMKTVQKLQPDQAKIDAKNQARQRRADKRARIDEIEQSLTSCVATLEAPASDPADVKSCLILVIKKMRSQDLSLSEL